MPSGTSRRCSAATMVPMRSRRSSSATTTSPRPRPTPRPSPLPVRAIQVEGRIQGTQEQRQVVYCGAAPRDVQDLSLREIALLQTLEPPKEWTLAPGDQTGFLVVFAQPPTDLREFGAEVV